MKFKLMDKIPEDFRGNLYFYFNEDNYFKAKISGPVDKRIIDCIFDKMELELKSSEDDDLKKGGQLLDIIQNGRELLGEEQINIAFGCFSCFDSEVDALNSFELGL